MKADEIKKLLPVVIQRTMSNSDYTDDKQSSESVVSTLVRVMENIHEPTEQLLENIERVFDPRQTPERFLPMLSHWMNLIGLFKPDKAGAEPSLWEERTLPTEAGYLRELIATSVKLSKWRGTNHGLQQVLQTATGISDFSIEEGPEPFHIRVGVPASAKKYWELIERIVAQEKPAHVTAEIAITQTETAEPTAEKPQA